MTKAAEQCREYLEAKYPGVRIGRQACRDTAGGAISQHSAYQYPDYDSNALDIMGGSTDGVNWSRADNIVLIQQIVDDLDENYNGWSIRVVLWLVPDHYGHAHIDFWPTIDVHMWCSTSMPDAVWIYSDGKHIRSDNPPPENGEYNGEDMSFATWIVGWVEGLAEDKNKARKEFQRLYDDGILEGDENTVDYWVGLLDDPTNPEWPGFYARTELSVWGR